MQSRRVVQPKRCLVLLPIGVTLRTEGPTFLAIYKHVLLPALRATGIPLDIFRGDEVLRAGLTLHEGALWLHNPHLVLADVTTAHSGVLHDLRLRSFLADRTVLLSQQPQDIPSQFVTYRQIIYTLSDVGMVQLSRALHAHVHAILGPAAPNTATTAESTMPLPAGSESA
jgi:hypothetical protein